MDVIPAASLAAARSHIGVEFAARGVGMYIPGIGDVSSDSGSLKGPFEGKLRCTGAS